MDFSTSSSRPIDDPVVNRNWQPNDQSQLGRDSGTNWNSEGLVLENDPASVTPTNSAAPDPRVSNATFLLSATDIQYGQGVLDATKDYLGSLSTALGDKASSHLTAADTVLSAARQLGQVVGGPHVDQPLEIGILTATAVGITALQNSDGGLTQQLSSSVQTELQSAALQLGLNQETARVAGTFLYGLQQAVAKLNPSDDRTSVTDVNESMKSSNREAAAAGQALHNVALELQVLASDYHLQSPDIANQLRSLAADMNATGDQSESLAMIATILNRDEPLPAAMESVAQSVAQSKTSGADQVLSNYQVFLDQQYKIMAENLLRLSQVPKEASTPAASVASMGSLVEFIQASLTPAQEIVGANQEVLAQYSVDFKESNPEFSRAAGDAATQTGNLKDKLDSASQLAQDIQKLLEDLKNDLKSDKAAYEQLKTDLENLLNVKLDFSTPQKAEETLKELGHDLGAVLRDLQSDAKMLGEQMKQIGDDLAKIYSDIVTPPTPPPSPSGGQIPDFGGLAAYLAIMAYSTGSRVTSNNLSALSDQFNQAVSETMQRQTLEREELAEMNRSTTTRGVANGLHSVAQNIDNLRSRAGSLLESLPPNDQFAERLASAVGQTQALQSNVQSLAGIAQTMHQTVSDAVQKSADPSATSPLGERMAKFVGEITDGTGGTSSNDPSRAIEEAAKKATLLGQGLYHLQHVFDAAEKERTAQSEKIERYATA